MEEKKESQTGGWCNGVDSRHTLMSAPTLSRDAAAPRLLFIAWRGGSNRTILLRYATHRLTIIGTESKAAPLNKTVELIEGHFSASVRSPLVVLPSMVKYGWNIFRRDSYQRAILVAEPLAMDARVLVLLNAVGVIWLRRSHAGLFR